MQIFKYIFIAADTVDISHCSRAVLKIVQEIILLKNQAVHERNLNLQTSIPGNTLQLNTKQKCKK